MTVFINRVRLKNYRSIARCNVHLGAVTFLVGANGAGKSNFLDALRLISDALNRTLDHALRERGGLHEVRRRSSDHPTHFTIRVDFTLGQRDGHYSFSVGAKSKNAWSVAHEECCIGDFRYRVREGELIVQSHGTMPPAARDRLYLVNAAGLPAFRPVYDALSRMGFYNLQPDRMRDLQAPDEGLVLKRDGSNLASMIARLDLSELSGTKARILEYLKRVVPGISDLAGKRIGHMETIEFFQEIKGPAAPWKFPAINMSDGTLRALAILTALFQGENDASYVHLVGIEEPETALHPAAARVLRECMLEASERVQVLATSHSADLLDDHSILPEMLRAVVTDKNQTTIGGLSGATRSALKDDLFTAGELLKLDQLDIDPATKHDRSQLRLFEVVD